MDVQQYNSTKAAADAENQTGSWSAAPSLAASTVAMENTSGLTVWVDVSGGTVTAIKADGNVTGLTAGSFRLAPNASIAITYSVAPTVGWSFDTPAAIMPVGAWSGAPSLAASRLFLCSTRLVSQLLFMFPAVTVTVIKVDGVTTGLTAGSFRLRRGSSINLTHSVDPTLAWVYA